MMETGLFEIEAEHVREYREPNPRDVMHAIFRQNNPETNADAPALEFARCFLRLANLPNFVAQSKRLHELFKRRAGTTAHQSIISSDEC
jgi:hypothetical protein